VTTSGAIRPAIKAAMNAATQIVVLTIVKDSIPVRHVGTRWTGRDYAWMT
jgi:hypothetical protein